MAGIKNSKRKQQLYNYGALFQAASFFNLKWNIEQNQIRFTWNFSRKLVHQHFESEQADEIEQAKVIPTKLRSPFLWCTYYRALIHFDSILLNHSNNNDNLL